MRIDRMDKLDRINFYQAMHSNLVKWWTFNMVDPDELLEGEEQELLPELEDYDADAIDAMAEELLADALGEDADTAFPGGNMGYAFGSGGEDAKEAEDAFANSDLDPEAAAAAMEIFNRLQAEAAADEAAKLAEIEAAKALADSHFN